MTQEEKERLVTLAYHVHSSEKVNVAYARVVNCSERDYTRCVTSLYLLVKAEADRYSDDAGLVSKVAQAVVKAARMERAVRLHDEHDK